MFLWASGRVRSRGLGSACGELQLWGGRGLSRNPVDEQGAPSAQRVEPWWIETYPLPVAGFSSWECELSHIWERQMGPNLFCKHTRTICPGSPDGEEKNVHVSETRRPSPLGCLVCAFELGISGGG